MIDIALTVLYLACWLASSIFATRWLADNWRCCGGRSVDGQRRLMDGYRSSTGRGTCLEWHGPGCFQADGEITIPRFIAATALSAAWPALIPLALTWTLANKRATVIGLQRDIARLEREAGIR